MTSIVPLVKDLNVKNVGTVIYLKENVLNLRKKFLTVCNTSTNSNANSAKMDIIVLKIKENVKKLK